MRIATGRKHQIRVHSAHVGHAVVCDGRYSTTSTYHADLKWCPRNFLHRSRLCFTINHRTIDIEQRLPADLTGALRLCIQRESKEKTSQRVAAVVLSFGEFSCKQRMPMAACRAQPALRQSCGGKSCEHSTHLQSTLSCLVCPDQPSTILDSVCWLAPLRIRPKGMSGIRWKPHSGCLLRHTQEGAEACMDIRPCAVEVLGKIAQIRAD